MSLINQALRKAQRDRQPARMASPDEQAATHPVGSAVSGMRPPLIIGLIVVVALLLGLVIGLSLVIFKNDTDKRGHIARETPSAQADPQGLTPPVEKPAVPQITPPATTASRERSAMDSTAGEPAVVEELRKAREAAEAQAAAQTKAAAEKAAFEAAAAEKAAARAAAEPSEAIITWLSKAKLSGVKISEKESKVILNGEAYTVGEYVNYRLKLKLMAVQATRVLFVDNNGKKYMKRL